MAASSGLAAALKLSEIMAIRCLAALAHRQPQGIRRRRREVAPYAVSGRVSFVSGTSDSACMVANCRLGRNQTAE
jgi:hypothetical protein